MKFLIFIIIHFKSFGFSFSSHIWLNRIQWMKCMRKKKSMIYYEQTNLWFKDFRENSAWNELLKYFDFYWWFNLHWILSGLFKPFFCAYINKWLVIIIISVSLASQAVEWGDICCQHDSDFARMKVHLVLSNRLWWSDFSGNKSVKKLV